MSTKMKIFEISGSGTAEKQVKKWLEENKNIEIVSSSHAVDVPGNVSITVFYKEK